MSTRILLRRSAVLLAALALTAQGGSPMTEASDAKGGGVLLVAGGLLSLAWVRLERPPEGPVR